VMLKEKPVPTAAMVGFWASGFAPANDWVNDSAATGWKTAALRGVENKAMEDRTAAAGKRIRNGLVDLAPPWTRLARKDSVVNISSLSHAWPARFGGLPVNRVPGCPSTVKRKTEDGNPQGRKESFGLGGGGVRYRRQGTAPVNSLTATISTIRTAAFRKTRFSNLRVFRSHLRVCEKTVRSARFLAVAVRYDADRYDADR
jgi:hypothetical protein